MFYLIFGEDTFRSKQKLEAVKEKYYSLYGEYNLVDVNACESSFDFIAGQISAAPFLANKRLVVIRYISKAKDSVREEMVKYLPKIPDSTVVFFYEEKLDLRLAIFKILTKEKKQYEEFKFLEPIKLKKWTEEQFKNAGFEIEPTALVQLISSVGSNLWELRNEIEKIISYKLGQKLGDKSKLRVSRDDIDLLVSKNIQISVFDFTDYLGQRNLEKSLIALDKLIYLGENELKLFGLVASQFRNLASIKDILEKRPGLNNYEASKILGINPYVLSKIIPQAKKVSFNWVKNAYSILANLDFEIKTGRIEPKLGLNLLVMRLCGNFNIE